jgi:lipid II:glycine glycyltransferase (peptidoglycan interpeptide bridge formation enzyme)
MEIQKVKEKKTWEDFFLECGEKTFLQSWNWGEFQKRMGNKIFRFGVFSGSELIALAFVVKIVSKRGVFLLIQHGPIIKTQSAEFKTQNQNSKLKTEILRTILKELKKIAVKEKARFVRIAPLWERTKENIKIFHNLGFKEAPMHASAYEASWKLDITSSEDELLANMRKTTRYLIRKSLKNKDIEILKSEKLEDIKIYQKLTQEVAERQKFVPFSFDFIKNEFDIFLKGKQAILIFGKYKDEITAGALIIFWSKIAFYHQAASQEKYSKFSIPYLVQWEAIKEAKKRGCVLYDFWGYVDPFKNPRHPWAGPTLFKMGFGGYKREYVKTQDFPFSVLYWLTYLFEKVRKIKRRL